jgi:hypothetical protein
MVEKVFLLFFIMPEGCNAFGDDILDIKSPLVEQVIKVLVGCADVLCSSGQAP